MKWLVFIFLSLGTCFLVNGKPQPNEISSSSETGTGTQQPYALITSGSDDPQAWAGGTIGRYFMVEDTVLNGSPVYKHEFLELYLFVNQYGDIGVGEDISQDSYYLTASSYDDGSLYTEVWNGYEQEWLPNPSFTLELHQDLPKFDSYFAQNSPCKLELSSLRPFATNYPDQMGVYTLIPGDLCHGRPVWQKGENNFLIMDDAGSWVVTERHLCAQENSEGFVYFGTVDNYYVNAKLPTLGQPVWAHIGDSVDDIIKDNERIEDESFQIYDVCLGDVKKITLQESLDEFNSKSYADENCLCLHWDNCVWSNNDYNTAKDVSKETEEYKKIQMRIHLNICGEKPEDHMVYCCGSDQRPRENVKPFDMTQIEEVIELRNKLKTTHSKLNECNQMSLTTAKIATEYLDSNFCTLTGPSKDETGVCKENSGNVGSTGTFAPVDFDNLLGTIGTHNNDISGFENITTLLGKIDISSLGQQRKESLRSTAGLLSDVRNQYEERGNMESQKIIIDKAELTLNKVVQFFDDIKNDNLLERKTRQADQNAEEKKDDASEQETNDDDLKSDPVPIIIDSLQSFDDHLSALKDFLKLKEDKPECGPNAANELKRISRLIENFEELLSTRNSNEEKVLRKRTLEQFYDLYIDQALPWAVKIERLKNPTYSDSFEAEQSRLKSQNYNAPTKDCKLQWGRQLTNLVGENEFIDVEFNITKPKECLESCELNSDCTAFTFDKQSGTCYLKNDDNAARLSEDWKHQFWSARTVSCATGANYTRSCSKRNYGKCIENILREYKITASESLDLNWIKPDDRITHDTLDEEYGCLLEHCRWTPTVNLDREISVPCTFHEEMGGTHTQCPKGPVAGAVAGAVVAGAVAVAGLIGGGDLQQAGVANGILSLFGGGDLQQPNNRIAKCHNIEVILRNDVLAKQSTRPGIYRVDDIVNEKTSWKSTNTAIWYDPKFKDWAIGFSDDIGTSKYGLISIGDQIDKIPNDIPNDNWKYWDGDEWTKTAFSDIDIKCTDVVDVKIEEIFEKYMDLSLDDRSLLEDEFDIYVYNQLKPAERLQFTENMKNEAIRQIENLENPEFSLFKSGTKSTNPRRKKIDDLILEIETITSRESSESTESTDDETVNDNVEEDEINSDTTLSRQKREPDLCKPKEITIQSTINGVPSTVTAKTISIDRSGTDSGFRFQTTLTIPDKNGKPRMPPDCEKDSETLYVMFNPSDGGGGGQEEGKKPKLDLTLNTILRFSVDSDLTDFPQTCSVRIINLFNARDADPKSLLTEGKQLKANNLLYGNDREGCLRFGKEFVGTEIDKCGKDKNCKKIIFAPGKTDIGDNADVKERRDAIAKKINESNKGGVFALNKDGTPKHPRNWEKEDWDQSKFKKTIPTSDEEREAYKNAKTARDDEEKEKKKRKKHFDAIKDKREEEKQAKLEQRLEETAKKRPASAKNGNAPDGKKKKPIPPNDGASSSVSETSETSLSPRSSCNLRRKRDAGSSCTLVEEREELLKKIKDSKELRKSDKKQFETILKQTESEEAFQESMKELEKIRDTQKEQRKMVEKEVRNKNTKINPKKIKSSVSNQVKDYKEAQQATKTFSNYEEKETKRMKNEEKETKRMKNEEKETKRMKINDRGNKIGNKVSAVGDAVGAVSQIASGDALEVVSGVLSVIATVGGFLGPIGGAVAAVAGVVNGILSLFGGGGKSEAEIMQDMITEQTEAIFDKIDEQTEILKKEFEELAKKGDRNTEAILESIKATNFHQMVDDMRGVKTLLTIKQKHLDEYQTSCIHDWTEIAFEANMIEITFQMGRVASATERFCSARETMGFCGQLIFQYALLATFRDTVHVAAMNVVLRSYFYNKNFKLLGLNAELKKMGELDKQFLEPIVRSVEEDNLFCHVGCAVRGIKNTLANDFDVKVFSSENITLSQGQIGIIKKFLKKIKIKINFKTAKNNELQKSCDKCYVKDVTCCNKNKASGRCDETPKIEKEEKNGEEVKFTTFYVRDEESRKCMDDRKSDGFTGCNECKYEYVGKAHHCGWKKHHSCKDYASSLQDDDNIYTLAHCRKEGQCGYTDVVKASFGKNCWSTSNYKVLCSSCSRAKVDQCRSRN